MDLPFPSHPPKRPLPSALAWALRTALSSPSAVPDPAPVSWDLLDPILRASGLWPVVAVRLAHRGAKEWLDSQGDARARIEREVCAEQALRAIHTATLVIRIAHHHDLPVVFLKGTALHLSGRVPPCGRPLSDVDVLVPVETARRLEALLATAGFRRRGPSLSRHHLDPLAPPVGLPVEIHLHLPGCSSPDAPHRPLRYEDLASAGCIETVSLGDLTASIPTSEILAAHTIVHGLRDHGLRPDRYPPWRWVTDLSAIATDARAHRWMSWVQGLRDGPRWARAFEALLDHLRRLPAEDSLPEDPEAERLFLHLVAGTLDPRYRLALRLREWWPWPPRFGIREGFAKALHRLRHPDRIPGDRLGPRGMRWATALRAVWEFYLAMEDRAGRSR